MVSPGILVLYGSMKTESDDSQHLTIAHVFDSAIQDAERSTSVLQDTITHINKKQGNVKEIVDQIR